MRLTEITIDSFKTIATPQRLFIDSKITTLVGPNESGKTNVLQAINAVSANFELKREHVSKSKRDNYTKIFPSLEFTFLLENEENEKIKKLMPGLKIDKTISIKRCGNDLEFFDLMTAEKFVASTQNELYNLEAEKNTLLKELANLEETLLNESRNSGAHSSNLARNNSLKVMVHKKRKIKIEEALEEINATIHNSRIFIQNAEKGIILTDNIVKKDLLNLFPQMIHLNDIEIMPESIPIEEIKKQNTQISKIIGNLLEIGGINDFSILDQNHREIKHILRNASFSITEAFIAFWSQEKIEIEIEKQGTDLAISINGGVSISSSPEERSEGFQWLLSFFAYFAKNLKKDLFSNAIFLIDEPAIRLHPKGQKDLLKLFEEVSKRHQIIYSTHSPFLINKNFPQRLRLLKKVDKKGTQINNKPYAEIGCRFWEPLKSAIGISLGDMLSLGETNLIVEGISEQIVISGISQRFADLDYHYIDLEKISIIPAMGATCEEALAKLALSEELDAICLLDDDAEGKKAFSKLSKIPQLKLIKISDLKKSAITIEDLFPQEAYIKAFNDVSKEFNDDFKEFDVSKEDKGGIVQVISKYSENSQYGKLDKVAVANKLINNLDITRINIGDYDCFKKLFVEINEKSKKQKAN